MTLVSPKHLYIRPKGLYENLSVLVIYTSYGVYAAIDYINKILSQLQNLKIYKSNHLAGTVTIPVIPENQEA